MYVDIAYVEEKVVFSIKNVSEHSLARENSNAGDLTERFIPGIRRERPREVVWDFPSQRALRF